MRAKYNKLSHHWRGGRRESNASDQTPLTEHGEKNNNQEGKHLIFSGWVWKSLLRKSLSSRPGEDVCIKVKLWESHLPLPRLADLVRSLRSALPLAQSLCYSQPWIWAVPFNTRITTWEGSLGFSPHTLTHHHCLTFLSSPPSPPYNDLLGSHSSGLSHPWSPILCLFDHRVSNNSHGACRILGTEHVLVELVSIIIWRNKPWCSDVLLHGEHKWTATCYYLYQCDVRGVSPPPSSSTLCLGT